ncbi:bifunctional 2-polyprenyl-6-hydroxyphenol methylase/3-demethylubiquinol 3-O-methyltransferase UbiG [Cyanobium sp. CH-040]|uniref:class I SAM-dependent methyltransferase n=1 Tax=Cyanobium sp. CH-040 TaxID=2823708 RepID=UPI0020CDF8FC|nr:class I SAM-dependent methyltransferase [Cyanobium sp. CH-040]MCP9927200.1 class I SAM-dependent methyltransferase [Cyanobium sp. CH-040]
MNTPDPDDIAEAFLGYAPNPLRYNASDESKFEVHKLITSLIQQNSSVLEIGCGTGVLGKILSARTDIEFEGVEPSLTRAQEAKAKGLTIHVGFFTSDLAERLGSFDVVVLADVIEHLANPAILLNSAKVVMKTTSILVVSVPNIAHWSIRLSLLMGKFDYQESGILDATHLRWFTRSTLSTYLQRCGFRIQEIKYTSGYLLGAYSWARRALAPFLCERKQRVILDYIVNALPGLFACQIVCSCSIDPKRKRFSSV